MNRKSFQPTDLTLSESGEIMVAFSRFLVIDHDNDVTFPGALPAGKTVAMSAYNHGSWEGALPLGKGVISETGDLGIFTGQFLMDTDQGRNGYHTVKGMGETQEWSYGYKVLPPSGPETFEGKRVQALRKLDVFEVSPVLLGAGIGTTTLAIKSGGPGTDQPYAEHLSGVLDAVKALFERTEGKADWRAKEGRALSAANLAALRELADTLGMTAQSLVTFLAEHDPAQPKADTSLAIEIARARSLGIT
jgi:hypothetical protein